MKNFIILIGVLLMASIAFSAEKIEDNLNVESKALKRDLQINFGIGRTSFTGNRGEAYSEEQPLYHLSGQYFIYKQTALTFGIEHSKHVMYIDTYVTGSQTQIIGAVETTFIKPFFGFKHYLSAETLGRSAEYWKPYFSGRLDYWNQTNDFVENNNLSNQSSSAIGSSFGFGSEFSLVDKETYINVEFLYSFVNFFDDNTQDYRQLDPNQEDTLGVDSDYGFDDLKGNAYTIFASYNIVI